MAEPDSPFTEEQLKTDAVSKKEILQFVQEHASIKFLREHKIYGKLASIAKCTKKDALVVAYQKLFELKAFKKEGEEEEEAEEEAKKDVKKVTKKMEKVGLAAKGAAKEKEEPRYTKKISKKGDGSTFPRKGGTVGCFYKGTLSDGTVFDTNMGGSKKKKGGGDPLKFKVGTGKVIRGWDEALLTMTLGEKAELVIEPIWAYGKKGLPEGKIPPNSTLTFEVELVSID